MHAIDIMQHRHRKYVQRIIQNNKWSPTLEEKKTSKRERESEENKRSASKRIKDSQNHSAQ